METTQDNIDQLLDELMKKAGPKYKALYKIRVLYEEGYFGEKEYRTQLLEVVNNEMVNPVWRKFYHVLWDLRQELLEDSKDSEHGK